MNRSETDRNGTEPVETEQKRTETKQSGSKRDTTNSRRGKTGRNETKKAETEQRRPKRNKEGRNGTKKAETEQRRPKRNKETEQRRPKRNNTDRDGAERTETERCGSTRGEKTDRNGTEGRRVAEHTREGFFSSKSGASTVSPFQSAEHPAPGSRAFRLPDNHVGCNPLVGVVLLIFAQKRIRGEQSAHPDQDMKKLRKKVQVGYTSVFLFKAFSNKVLRRAMYSALQVCALFL